MNVLAEPLVVLPVLRGAALASRVLRRAAAFVLAGLLVAACSGADNDFETAQRSNTQAAWDDYLRQHPEGEHARAARQLLAQLVEAREWERARAADTVDGYQQYLRGYPQGPHALDASTAVANLSLAAAPADEATTTAPSRAAPTPSRRAAPPAAAQAPRQPPPAAAHAPKSGTPAAKAKPAAVANTAPVRRTAQGFRVQLGAFAKGSVAASAAWQALMARYPELLEREPVIAAARTADGRAIHRLQVGGYDRAGATALCQKLAADHNPCLVVAPAPAAARGQPRSG